MNTEEVISSQETERGSSDVVADEATAAIRTFNCELFGFYSNIEKGLSVHLASNMLNIPKSKQMKATVKQPMMYICCPDGFIAVHKGVMYNGSLCKTTQCEYCYDE